jgi:hypothetical protein
MDYCHSSNIKKIGKKKRHTWGNMNPRKNSFWEKAAKKSPYSEEKIAQFAISRQ